MHHDIIIHLLGHAVDIVVGAVVHDGIGEHEHHVTLELGRCANRPVFNVLLNGHHVHWSAAAKKGHRYAAGIIIATLDECPFCEST